LSVDHRGITRPRSAHTRLAEPIPTPHDGHELVKVSGRRDNGEMVALLLCMSCSRTVRRLALCGARTKRGTPCKVYVRDDLGFTRCWSHGEGAGHTSTPRRASREELSA
jgi:hypothetical protein